MILVEDVVKRFGDREVLGGLTFDVAAGSVVTLIGPSGCGKTTLLNILDGLDVADRGRVQFDAGFDCFAGFMMQESALLPWRTLQQNATLGWEVGPSGGAPKASVAELFEAFDLAAYRDTYPDQASSGMRQRVALMRTLIFGRDVFLLDEPFSNLDFDIKLQVQRYLVEFQRRTGATLLLVTHDIEDAIALSDRVIVLSGQPTVVKTSIDIQPRLGTRDPVEARKSPQFRELFIDIVGHLKYLHGTA